MANPQVPVHGETIESSWGADVVSRVVPVYADAAARDVAVPTPDDGQVAYTADDDILWLHRAGKWVAMVVADPAEISPLLSLTGTGGQDPAIELLDSHGVTAKRWSIYRNRTANTLNVHSNDYGAVFLFGTQCAVYKDLICEHDLYIRNIGTSSQPANVYIAANGNTFQSTSSGTGKTNVEPFAAGGDMIDRLTPVGFTSTHEPDDGRRFVGFIAEDVAAAFPEAGVDNNYDVRALVALLVAEVKDLRKRVAVLEELGA